MKSYLHASRGTLAKYIIQALLVIIVALLVLGPTVMLFYGVLRTAPPGRGGEWTVVNLQGLLSPTTTKYIINTLWFSGLTTIIATLIGVSLGFLTARTNLPGKAAIGVLVLVPRLMPEILNALSWIFLASPSTGVINNLLKSAFNLTTAPLNVYSWGGMAWVQGIIFASYTYIFSRAAFESMDSTLEEASTISGAGTIQTFFRITLPLSLPSIFGAAVLVFVLSMGSLGIPAYLGFPSGNYVITTKIYELIQSYPPNYGQATSYCLFALLITSLGVMFQYRLLGRGRKFTVITGRGFRPRIIDLGRLKYVALVALISYIFITVIMPIGVVTHMAFFRNHQYGQFTLSNFKRVLIDFPFFAQSIVNSLTYSAVGSVLTIGICVVISFLLVRSKIRGLRILDLLSHIPVAIPGVVMAVGLLWFWISFPIVPIYGTPWILILAWSTRYLPYGLGATTSSLRKVDKELEEQATICGASWLTSLKDIVLPLIRGGVFGGWMLLFISFLTELSSSQLLYTMGTEVVSVSMFHLYFWGDWPSLAALCFLTMLIVIVVLSIVQKTEGKIMIGGA